MSASLFPASVMLVTGCMGNDVSLLDLVRADHSRLRLHRVRFEMEATQNKISWPLLPSGSGEHQLESGAIKRGTTHKGTNCASNPN